ncbi:MAG: hypothetical protein ACYSTY_09975 [Planctomycetota bacterium]|jgi:hypothetical protein
MKKNTTRLWREALAAALATVGTIAEEAGYSLPMWDQYRNQRPPSRPAVLALASALRKRGQGLIRYADRLEEAAGDDLPGGAGGRTR